MNTQILVHLFPNELDAFEWQSTQIRLGRHLLDKEDVIILDVTLNLNFIDWGKTTLPKQFILEKFNKILNLWDWANVISDVNEDNSCRGCDDKRRNSIRLYSPDNFVYLDCDIVFRSETLKCLMWASKEIKSKYYIISPEIIKVWDNTWDCLTNKNYINISPGMDRYKNADPFSVISDEINESIFVRKNNQFKFAGGWFNLISSNLLKFTDIPDSFGPYGVDDTYVMYCAELMKLKNYDIQQYVIENLIIIENFKYKPDHYSQFLKTIDKKDEFRSIAEKNLHAELIKFSKKLIF